MPVSQQRREDWGVAFQVRPVVVDLGGRRHTISPHEAHLLLGELGRLPKARHQAAEDTAVGLVSALAGGVAFAPCDEDRRCLLRAVEGVRARRALPTGLVRLRNLLLQASAI